MYKMILNVVYEDRIKLTVFVKNKLKVLVYEEYFLVEYDWYLSSKVAVITETINKLLRQKYWLSFINNI